MELKEFIKQSIIQITDGIIEGNNYIRDNKYGDGISDGKFREVNFDVAVTSNNEEVSGMAGKISVANIVSFGGKDEISARSINTSRLQFKIALHIRTSN